MHCPKCGQIYGENSQRFCDNDGMRLVAGGADVRRLERQRVFSTVMPLTESAAPTDPGRRSAAPPSNPGRGDDEYSIAELFFESDEDEEIQFSAVEPAEATENEPENPGVRVFGRKVSINEIPSGHVEIDYNGKREHPSLNDHDFDIENPADLIGRRVKGRYQVVEMLGEDDTGFAFLAEDRLVDGKRVMVRILMEADLDEVTESIFAEERVSLSHLNHPNVVRVIDSGEFSDGTTFLISEHVDGLSVADILYIHGPLEPARVARIIRQAGAGLSEVHNEGVLHRDLRPEDLVVHRADDESETVKLSDFGVSDGAPNDDNLPFKAPEILEGRIPTVPSDIYSLGVIAYQILTGHLPFRGDTPKELLAAEQEGLKTLPSWLRPGLNPAADYVFERVLTPEPLLRYPTAREFGDALHSALTSVGSGRSMGAYSSSRLPVIVAGNEEQVPAPIEVETIEKAPEPQPPAETMGEAAWTRRSPEPVNEPGRNWVRIAVITLGGLLVLAAGIWYYLLNRTSEPAIVVPPEAAALQPSPDPASQLPDGTIEVEVPPPARKIAPPPNSQYFQTSRQNLKGDILRNFVGFSVYYPKNWSFVGPQQSATADARGKFLDISRKTRDGILKEQMLVSYYTSSGTYTTDAPRFADISREASETLKKLIPNYQLVSEGETSVNGGWRAYEIKFQGSGTADNGQRLLVWGRRLFIPPSRPGVRSGFEVTLLATSDADGVHGVDDVGTRGELAPVFATFEPSQNF